MLYPFKDNIAGGLSKDDAYLDFCPGKVKACMDVACNIFLNFTYFRTDDLVHNIHISVFFFFFIHFSDE